ncbi:MAG: hypothetical protein ACRD26_02225 [Vicinamibacterales bacterium]
MGLLVALLSFTIAIDAPPSLASAAERLRGIDRENLSAALQAAGLEIPAAVEVTLVPEDDPMAQGTPRWVVGQAFGIRSVAIFPQRVTRYPHDSLESVLRHEVVHLALFASAGGRPLPRWFHEGVATSVEAGWGVTDELRLLVAALAQPTIDDVSELFRSDAQPGTHLAYRLATALITDIRDRHGADVPGRIAARVSASPGGSATGQAFLRAFAAETGETPDAAAALAWRSYRNWSRWVPALASASAVWSFILVLAVVAYLARRRRRAHQRSRWEDDRFD